MRELHKKGRLNKEGFLIKSAPYIAGSFTSPLSLIIYCSLWALGGEIMLLSKQCFWGGGGEKEGVLAIKQCFFVSSVSWGGGRKSASE